MAETTQAPEGYRYEWVPDNGWRIGGDLRNCRMRGCWHAAVAALSRKHGNGRSWWHYCADHLYGRKIEDGIVKVRILVAEETSNG